MYKIKFVLIIMVVALFNSCQTTQKEEHSTNLNLVPYPAKVYEQKGEFELTAATTIVAKDEKAQPVADFLQSLLRTASGFEIAVEEKGSTNAIQLEIVDGMEDEAYTLSVKSNKVVIKASSGAGLFYGVQTFRQLLPAEIESKTAIQQDWKVACVEIEDEPRYSYRGMHLDVARHFYPVEFIKKFIDMLALHKMNRFHWHLTEDQGWRIEIKKYPKLQEIAAYRDETLIGHYSDQPHQFDGQRYGGYYTQEEIKEVVAYAQKRFVTVIPEIEMPGHSLAALSAYPELGCTDGPFKSATKWGIFEDVYCPKEETFEFLENVLLEVFELFPSKYIHIGGDECPKAAWKKSQFCQDLIARENLKDEHGLQSYFISRMEKFINSHGRQIIGWDEILEGGLAPNATVMSWRGTEGGIAAARQGHDVIMTPTSHCYLDYYQSSSSNEPLAIGGFLPLKKVYNYEPTPTDSLTAEQEKHILGTQGNVWTEYMKTSAHVEYMAFPRALALAEINWSPKSARNYENFLKRLSNHFKRLDVMNVNYAKHIFDVSAKLGRNDKDALTVELNTLSPKGEVRYTTNGETPTMEAAIYKNPVELGEGNEVQAVVFEDGKPISNVLAMPFRKHKAVIRDIKLTTPPHPSYSEGGNEALVNGVLGSNSKFGDGQWLGWEGENVEAVIDLGDFIQIKEMTLRFFNSPGQWIYLPKGIKIEFSEDNKKFVPITEFTDIKPTKEKVLDVTLGLPTSVQYIKVIVENFGTIPQGAQGAGHKAWLFLDEIIVE